MPLDENDERFISRRLNFAISRFSQHIRRVNVHVSYEPKSQTVFSLRIRMQAMFMLEGSVSVETLCNELHSGAATTADRLARSIERELQNRLEANRSSMPF